MNIGVCVSAHLVVKMVLKVKVPILHVSDTFNLLLLFSSHLLFILKLKHVFFLSNRQNTLAINHNFRKMTVWSIFDYCKTVKIRGIKIGDSLKDLHIGLVYLILAVSRLNAL